MVLEQQMKPACCMVPLNTACMCMIYRVSDYILRLLPINGDWKRRKKKKEKNVCISQNVGKIKIHL